MANVINIDLDHSTKENLKKLNNIMISKDFISFELYSCFPNKFINKTIGNFKFVQSDGKLLVRYLGTNLKFSFLNQELKWSGYYNPKTTFIYKDEIYNSLSNYFIYRGRTYNGNTVMNLINDLYLRYTNKNTYHNKDKSLLKEKDFVEFKKIIKLDKEKWSLAREESIKELLGISLSEWENNIKQIGNCKNTQFIMKIAPMLRSLRDECDLILNGLNDPSGPSKTARDEFSKVYKQFQQIHNGKSILYGIKTLKSKKKK